MIERALPPDDRPADPDPSALGESAPTDRRLPLDQPESAPDGEADGKVVGEADGKAAGEADREAAGEADGEADREAAGEADGEPAGVAAGEAAEETDQTSDSTDAARGDGSDCPRPLVARIEALLFASGRALSAGRLGKALRVQTPIVQTALAELIATWKAREGAVELVEVGGGYRFLTRPDYHEDVASLRPVKATQRLSPAALETLSVVAYRQPITRADVEAVRGVQSGPLLRLLQERDLIRITGRSPEPGHPLLYGTTKRFLDHFGLKSLKALPDLKDVLESA
jgi:segregation and condensation protein B